MELGEDEDGDPITTLQVEELAEVPPPVPLHCRRAARPHSACWRT